MKFIEQIKQRAKQNIKTICLPEASDIRTIEAASIALNEGYANIILIGDEEKDYKTAKNSGCEFIYIGSISEKLNPRKEKQCPN